ncbi:MAG: nucleotidyltransferase family protein [Armatimonadetes bacterium]|nr:nucleotidyltransferase family protein [Armatimonadota bacterium]
MDALITAGGPMPDSLSSRFEQPFKCVLEFGGHRLIDTALDAAHNAARVGRVCVVGPNQIRDSLDLRPEDLFVEDRGSGPANIMAGLEALGDQQQVVFISSDLPFLTAEGLDDLVARTPADKGFVLPIYRREEVEARLPEATNKYVPLKEGDLTASSVMVMSPTLIAQHRERIEMVFGARKHFARLFGMIGPLTALRFALSMKFGWRLMNVPALEAAIARLMGFPVAAIFGCDAAFNFDIDHDRDYAECEQLLVTLAGR